MAQTTQSYQMLGQSALDSKLVFTNVESFYAYRDSQPETYAFNFYKGMMVYFQEEEKIYIWETPYSKYYKENAKLLDENFIYPLNSVYNDLDYSGIAFNLIEFPYQKENLGQWDDLSGQKTLEVQIYHNSPDNPFKLSELIAKWPSADRFAFIAGNITGLKIYGLNVSLYQEIPVEDYPLLDYTIWNGPAGYLQEIKIVLLEPGEILEEPGEDNDVDGNSFKDLKIVYDETEMVNKNSMYFKPVEDSFEIHVIDKLGVKRKYVEMFGSNRSYVGELTSASNTFTHNLNTKDVLVQAYDLSNGKSADITSYRTTANAVHVVLNTAYVNPIKILISKI